MRHLGKRQCDSATDILSNNQTNTCQKNVTYFLLLVIDDPWDWIPTVVGCHSHTVIEYIKLLKLPARKKCHATHTLFVMGKRSIKI